MAATFVTNTAKIVAFN